MSRAVPSSRGPHRPGDKKRAAVLAHRDAKANTLASIVTRIPRLVKLAACGCGWWAAALSAMMAWGAAAEGLCGWWLGLLASAGCVALAGWLWRLVSAEETLAEPWWMADWGDGGI